MRVPASIRKTDLETSFLLLMARLFRSFVNPSRLYDNALKLVGSGRPRYLLLWRSSRALLLKIAFLLAAGSSIAGQQAQPPSDPALLTSADAKERLAWANQWLQSDDPRRIAWAAWLVRQDHPCAVIDPARPFTKHQPVRAV
jgi:hypothetical protein